MAPPQVASDGNTYESDEIREWQLRKGTSPITREPIQPHFTPNLGPCLGFALAAVRSEPLNAEHTACPLVWHAAIQRLEAALKEIFLGGGGGGGPGTGQRSKQ